MAPEDRLDMNTFSPLAAARPSAEQLALTMAHSATFWICWQSGRFPARGDLTDSWNLDETARSLRDALQKELLAEAERRVSGVSRPQIIDVAVTCCCVLSPQGYYLLSAHSTYSSLRTPSLDTRGRAMFDGAFPVSGAIAAAYSVLKEREKYVAPTVKLRRLVRY
jgi:hypothetical protein